MTFTTRFAPSPTGPLHLGHAYSAMRAHDMAMDEGGDFLLRIDDLDQSRARPEWEMQIKDDLHWLGLSWTEPCRRQSEHLDEYREALEHLWRLGVLYPCTCSRRDIREALSAPQEGAPMHGPDGLIYPGTCRPKTDDKWTRNAGTMPTDVTLRLNMTRATYKARLIFDPQGSGPPTAHFAETGPRANTGFQRYEFTAEYLVNQVGDVVLARRDLGASYHLAVVVDDSVQDVSVVVRGEDLLEATTIHTLLRGLLQDSSLAQTHPMNHPIHHHHRLIRDEQGLRLAKRDDARAIAKYRSEGATPQDIRRMVGL